MIRRFALGLLAALGSLALGAVSARDALACACCSSEGQRSVNQVTIDAYAAGVLAEIRFAAKAQIFSGEADVADLQGIAAKGNAVDVKVAKAAGDWVFDVRQPGATGTLTFTMPKQMTKFEVDPRDPDRPASNNGPTLYKEWRMTAKAVGTGMFKGVSGGDNQMTVILHGRGNSCTDATQFTAWTIVLFGAKGTNSLFGSLEPQ